MKKRGREREKEEEVWWWWEDCCVEGRGVEGKHNTTRPGGNYMRQTEKREKTNRTGLLEK